MMRLLKVAGLLLGLGLMTFPLMAEENTEQEVRYLIDSVEQSGCSFERNGKSYAADDAADHLAMKYRRGKKYASSAENFIDRLASKSSMSGKPYYIACSGTAKVTSGSWLHQRLAEMREGPEKAS